MTDYNHILHLLTHNQWYLFYLGFIMIFAGYAKDTGIFMPFFNYLLKTIKNKKIVVLLISAFGGILPVPGRVSVSAGILDQIAPKNKRKRQIYGIIDYFATHHYYLWSPIEKSVIIPMAVLGMSYWGLVETMAPAIIVVFAFIIWLVIFKLDEENINVEIKKPCCGARCNIQPKNLLEYVIFATNILKEHTNEVKSFIEHESVTLFIASLIGFMGAFLLGSSSRFAAIVAILVTIYGEQYLLWFFTIEFIAYLLSPMHKCLYIGKSYFNTPSTEYYKNILMLSTVLLAVAGLITFTGIF